MEQPIRELLRKKVIDLKQEQGSYTETYNLVAVLVRLFPDAPEIVHERMASMYAQPSQEYKMSLPQLEHIYYKYRDDPNLKIKSKKKIDIYGVKKILDRIRRDLLFFLTVLEDPQKNYSILLDSRKSSIHADAPNASHLSENVHSAGSVR